MQKGIIPHSPSSSSSPLSTSYLDVRGQTFHWFAALSSLGKHRHGDVEWSHELCNRAEPPHLQDAVFHHDYPCPQWGYYLVCSI